MVAQAGDSKRGKKAGSKAKASATGHTVYSDSHHPCEPDAHSALHAHTVHTDQTQEGLHEQKMPRLDKRVTAGDSWGIFSSTVIQEAQILAHKVVDLKKRLALPLNSSNTHIL